jgi:glucose/arabinose dehydrogenase
VVRGARNPYGLAVRHSTGAAYVTINGQDSLGPTQPADHLLKISEGEDAGWPSCWPAFPGGLLHGSCDGVSPPVAVFPPHSSADGILFYDATQFGTEYQDSAFVSEWGTYFGTSPGRKVVRVVLATGTSGTEQGTVTDFATGFQHPLPLSIAPDGGLLIGDYGTGQVVEVFRTG